MNIYQDIRKELDDGKKLVLLTDLTKDSNGKLCSTKRYYTEEQLNAPEFKGVLGQKVAMEVYRSLANGELKLVQNSDNDLTVIEPFFPPPRLLVFGGGHIAKPLTEFAHKVGFAVTVIDDRLSFANKGRFPEADRVICENFVKSFDQLKFDSYTYVVIITRGHRHDMDCLREVVQRKWAYAGMIGSRKRVKSVKDQLISEGYSQEILDKVNSPIGLEIGAVTPEEIAISILGQLISYRRLQNPKLGRESAKVSWTEFDQDVVRQLCEDSPENKALVTVISTKGSVPRRAGAKMLVWPDGRILGSIGGGCSEGSVILKARDVIRSNEGFYIQDIDLTGTNAEDEGMVCGGIMKVLIESLDS